MFNNIFARVITCGVFAIVGLGTAGGLGCTKSQSLTGLTSPDPGIRSLHLSGPGTIAPGATGQLTVIGSRTDGSSEDVTAKVTFRPTYSNGLFGITYSQSGVATVDGRSAPGETSIQAWLGTLSSNALSILILPTGTYRLMGAVTEDGQLNGSPFVGNEVVEITSGTGVGVGQTAKIASWTDYKWYYFFYGVAGDLDVRASIDGYVPEVRHITVADQVRSDFDLKPANPPVDISGAWTVTVSASSACAGILPEIAATRVFNADITQRSSNFDVAWSGPTIFDKMLGPHHGTVLGNAVTIELASVDGDTYTQASLYDRLNPTQWIGFVGRINGTAADPEIRATLSGDLDLYPSASASEPAGAPTVQCYSDHSIIFRRR